MDRRPTEVPQPDWAPAELLRDAKTGWGPAHELGPYRLTGSRSDRQAISQIVGPRRPTGSQSDDWGLSDRDWARLVRPTGALHTNWGPHRPTGASQTD